MALNFHKVNFLCFLIQFASLGDPDELIAQKGMLWKAVNRSLTNSSIFHTYSKTLQRIMH